MVRRDFNRQSFLYPRGRLKPRADCNYANYALALSRDGCLLKDVQYHSVVMGWV